MTDSNVAALPASRESKPVMDITPRNLNEGLELAKLMATSEMVPKDYQGKPQNVLVAMQMGAEVGLQPMQALQNIAVINGRPAVFGDAALAIVKSHPDCQGVEEEITGDGDGAVATCIVRRRGQKAVVQTFSVADAKKASLWGKSGPWTSYPRRMLQMRARGFAIRDAFPDALRGMAIAEEVRDYPEERQVQGEHTFAEKTDTPKDRDSALAAKLGGSPSPAEPEREEEEPEPMAAETADEPSDLEKNFANIEEAIAAIEKPADANDIQDLIKTAALTSSQKAELRKLTNQKVKEVGKAV